MKKVQVGKDQENQTNNQVLTPRKKFVSRMSSYFPKRWALSYLNLTKNMKTHIRRQQHKKFTHQDIKQKEPPQKYRLGTISNTQLLAGLSRFNNYCNVSNPRSACHTARCPRRVVAGHEPCCPPLNVCYGRWYNHKAYSMTGRTKVVLAGW